MEDGVAFTWGFFLSFTAQIGSLQPSQKTTACVRDATLLLNVAASVGL